MMRSVWRIFRDDVRLVTGNLVALIAVLVLCIVPAVYAWLSIAASWDPYAGTGQLKIAVVNSDEGYESSLVPIRLNIGDRVVGELRGNEDYDWVSVDEGAALDGVRSGDYYAALVIPGDFSSKMMSALSSDDERVNVEYYLNMKANPDAAALAGTEGGGVVDDVRGKFVEAVDEMSLELTSDLVAFASGSGSKDAGTRLAVSLGEAADRLEAASDELRAFAVLAGATSAVTGATSEALSGAEASAAVSERGSSNATGSSSDASEAADDDSDNVISASVDALDAAVSAASSAAADIERQVRDAGSSSSVGAVGADAAQKLASDVATLATSVDAVSKKAQTVSNSLQDATESVAGSADSAAASLDFTHDNLSVAANKLGAAASKVRKFQSDVSAAIAKGNLDTVASIVGSSPSSVAQWLADPLQIEGSVVYPIDSYGSSVVPAYTVLAIWVGVVLLVMLVKTGVSRRRIGGYEAEAGRVLRLSELSFGRYLVFAAISLVQATIIALGDILFLRVQCIHPLLFFLACWMCAIVFSALAYALVLSFGGAGKALCVFLVAVQVVGLGCQFPVQAVGMLSPFVHGTCALQDAIAGFAGAGFALDLLRLAAFLVPSALLALSLRAPIIRIKNALAE